MQTTTCAPDQKANAYAKEEMSGSMPPEMRLIRGRILVAEAELLTVMTESGPLTGRAAASCLVRPECGDLVLLALPLNKKEAAYVLAVLERAAAETAMQIDLGAGARLSADKGAVEIAAGTDLRLSAGGRMEASAQTVTFTSAAVHWLTHTFCLLSKTVEAVCSVWKESSRERETTSEVWTQRLGDSYRHVQDLDETQAGMSRTLARETALVHGRVTYVQAEEFVKIDGGEVHLG